MIEEFTEECWTLGEGLGAEKERRGGQSLGHWFQVKQRTKKLCC